MYNTLYVYDKNISNEDAKNNVLRKYCLMKHIYKRYIKI